jgi:hypothetical protein
MTNPVCRVASCDKPVAEAHVCMRCAHNLERALGDIPAVIHQLNLTLAKQTRYADRNERGGTDTPLPMDPLASAAIDQLRGHLENWAKMIAEIRGYQIPIAETLSRPANLDILSRWMLHHVEWLRHHEAGHDCVDELTGDMRTARRVIDVPANRTTFPVGPCPEVDPGKQQEVYITRSVDGQVTSHCVGEVRAYIPNTEDQPARLECNTCHTVWESWQWLRAGRRIKDREATMKGTAA